MRYLAIITLTIMTLALMACSGSWAPPPPSPQADTPTQPEAAAKERADGRAGEILSPDNGAAGKNDGTADGPAPMMEPEPVMGHGAGGPAIGMSANGRPVVEETTMMGTPDVDVADDEMTRSRPSGPPLMPWKPGTPPDRDWRPRHEPKLKAGEVDDNARWQEYLRFVENYGGPGIHRTDLGNRQIVRVVDRDGNPVPNAEVVINAGGDGHGPLWTNTTYADGRTIFFPAEAAGPGMVMRDELTPPREFALTVRRDGFVNDATVNVQEDGTTQITLGGRMSYGANVPLDVLFLLDSTGSMSDEIRQIKSTVQSIARQVSSLQSNPDLRFGMVSYRDRTDDYVTQLYDFDGDVERFRRTIRGVRADGGDDYPESLNQALHEAVNDASWRKDAIRLIFLIADAPPHLDYAQDEDYAVEMVRARQRGIKVFSVASSGLDEQGEYVFRQIAQQTMGRFLFILYWTSPQGSLETPHDVEQYSVNRLDGLIVRLVQEELSGLRSSSQGAMMMK